MENIEEQEVEEFHFEWGKFLDALEFVESTNGKNTEGEAGEVGWLQIGPLCLKDVNESWNTNFTLNDCSNTKHGRELSRTICYKYITMYGCDTDYQSAAGCWNGGPNWRSKKGDVKARIKAHYKKVMKAMGEEI